MAVIVPTQSYPINGNNNFLLVAWEGLANGDEGEPFILSQYADRSVQVLGTFGTGGTVIFEGSNNGVTYSPLTDDQGTTLSFLTSKLSQIMQIVVNIKPRVTSGDGSTSINVYMLVRK
jgi:hypothetical protein